MTKSIRTIPIVATLLFGAATSVGCGHAQDRPPATAESAATTNATAALVEHHRYHHHGGVTLFIAMSLDTLGVPPPRRAAVEKIRADLHARMEPARIAEGNLSAALADDLADGTFDRARVDDAVTQVSVAAAAAHDATTDALNALHALLTPPERAALVDKVESHWTVWQQANSDETGTTHGEQGRLADLAADLDLTTTQIGTIRATLLEGATSARPLDRQEVASHLHAFGESFRSETFDARKLATGSSADAHVAGWGAARLARFVEGVSPVLTPEQRAAFAQQLREHARHDPSAQEIQ
jgi:Spy/CpxP family protein refolding chaperone